MVRSYETRYSKEDEHTAQGNIGKQKYGISRVKNGGQLTLKKKVAIFISSLAMLMIAYCFFLATHNLTTYSRIRLAPKRLRKLVRANQLLAPP